MALKEIIAGPRWIKAWVELLFAGVGTWFYVTSAGLSLRAGGRGFSPATPSITPGYFRR